MIRQRLCFLDSSAFAFDTDLLDLRFCVGHLVCSEVSALPHALHRGVELDESLLVECLSRSVAFTDRCAAVDGLDRDSNFDA